MSCYKPVAYSKIVYYTTTIVNSIIVEIRKNHMAASIQMQLDKKAGLNEEELRIWNSRFEYVLDVCIWSIILHPMVG